MRIGVGISADSVRAVALRGERVTWMERRSREPDEALADCLAAVLRNAPLRRWPRTSVRVALGPSLARVAPNGFA